MHTMYKLKLRQNIMHELLQTNHTWLAARMWDRMMIFEVNKYQNTVIIVEFLSHMTALKEPTLTRLSVKSDKYY